MQFRLLKAVRQRQSQREGGKRSVPPASGRRSCRLFVGKVSERLRTRDVPRYAVPPHPFLNYGQRQEIRKDPYSILNKLYVEFYYAQTFSHFVIS